MNDFKFINDHLTDEEILCQIAEEAAELAHAALKLIRAQKQTNPTPVKTQEAIENLKEEIADVTLVMDVFRTRNHITDFEFIDMIDGKAIRWINRIKNVIAEKVEEPVEKPVKTMMEDFFEKHPKAPIDTDGEPSVCPYQVGYESVRNCSSSNCLECWQRPLKEE